MKKIYEYLGKKPIIGHNVLIQDGAKIIGEVIIEDDVNIWYNAIIRGDLDKITLKKGCNVQENTTIHNDPSHEVSIGINSTIGHNCVIHGAIIGDNTVIGMGSILLNGAHVGNNCLVGANSLLTGNFTSEDGMLIMGSPAKVIRALNEKDLAYINSNGYHYQELAAHYLDNENE
ncbi:MAG: gamma carbonic anhydrase family protein [Bacilli bacterium]|jgi:carbonic anhydrase/acetyltransferase-like protein (isoleucine patch superfamily)|nr:gamma carbonic anhydrase family protein [Bacilli bacterium]